MDDARADVETGEPLAAVGVGVDADGVATVGGAAVFLGGVSANHDLAGLVGVGVAKAVPEKFLSRLLIQVESGYRPPWTKMWVSVSQ